MGTITKTLETVNIIRSEGCHVVDTQNRIEKDHRIGAAVRFG